FGVSGFGVGGGIGGRRSGLRGHRQAPFAIAADDEQRHRPLARSGAGRGDGRLAGGGLPLAISAGGKFERIAIVARVASGDRQVGPFGKFGGRSGSRQFGFRRGQHLT